MFAGVIGPFSLAARLLDVTEIMVDCYDEPDMVHTVMEKATQFLVEYCRAYKELGANGVVIAEPVTGLLSPPSRRSSPSRMCAASSRPCRTTASSSSTTNCGNAVLRMMDSILATGAAAYHFGNAINMADALALVPSDTVTMGNIDAGGEIRTNPESIRKATLICLPMRKLSELCDFLRLRHSAAVEMGEY